MKKTNLKLILTLIALLLLAAMPVSYGEGAKRELIYGSGIAADSLGNLGILYPPDDPSISYRFRAECSGTVDKILFFLVFRPGYYGGNGGQVLVQLQTDDSTEQHNPSGTVLGSRLIQYPMDPINHDYEGVFFVGWGSDPDVPRLSFPVIHLAPSPELEKGKLYHIVFSNPAENPKENFVSVDNLYRYLGEETNCTGDMQPRFNDEELALLYRDPSKGWQLNCHYTPIYSLYFTDGYSQGQSYYEGLIEVPSYISGNNIVKEKFTVSGNNKTVTAVSVRLAKRKFYQNVGDLTFKLENADGTVIEEGTVPANSIPFARELIEYNRPTPQWVSYNFSSLRILESGEAYNLILSAPEGDPYIIYPLVEGFGYNFTGMFKDGWGLYSNNNGTTWEGFHWLGHPPSPDAPHNPYDLQFYFSVFSYGDVTGNGSVDIADVQACVNIILGYETRPDWLQRADVNGGGVDILDLVAIVNIILGNP